MYSLLLLSCTPALCSDHQTAQMAVYEQGGFITHIELEAASEST